MNHIRNFKHNNSGFTLIEVMVAAVILFSVIATVSMVYRGAFLSSEKATKHVSISAVLPSVLATVKEEIQQQGKLSETTLSYKGNAWSVDYQWSASLVQYKAAPTQYDIDSGTMITPPKKYKLWLVDLTLQINGLIKQYQFNEYSWNEG